VVLRIKRKEGNRNRTQKNVRGANWEYVGLGATRLRLFWFEVGGQDRLVNDAAV